MESDIEMDHNFVTLENVQTTENTEENTEVRAVSFDEVCDDSGDDTDLMRLEVEEAIRVRQIEEEIEQADTVSCFYFGLSSIRVLFHFLSVKNNYVLSRNPGIGPK